MAVAYTRRCDLGWWLCGWWCQ